MRRMSEMVQNAYTVYLKGSFIVYTHQACESIMTLMATCKGEHFSLKSLNMEVFPRNPCRAKVEFVVKAIGPTSYDAVFEDAAEDLFSMKGEFYEFRIRTCSDPHTKDAEEGGAEA
jgi:hypothetical protein